MVKIRFFRGYKPELTANRLYNPHYAMSRDFVRQNADCRLQLRILFVRQLAVIELGIRFVVILNFLVRGHADIGQASSLRGVIFADGNIEIRAVGEREAGLEIALAAGLLAHDLRPVVFLKRRGKNSAAE